jgi:carbamoyl-phosphate synthase large subunit
MSTSHTSPITLLLTGAGGVAIPGLVDHLRKQGARVLTADMNPAAPGLVLGDKGFCIPPATSPLFAKAIQRICEEEHVDVLVPLVDEELLPLQVLNSGTLHVLTPRAQFIATCLDKYRLCGELARHGIPFPKVFTADTAPDSLEFPIILKPRTGRGSRGVVRIDSADELKKTLATLNRPLEEMMIQEFIDGPEFTVSVVVWRDGAIQAVVPKESSSKKASRRWPLRGSTRGSSSSAVSSRKRCTQMAPSTCNFDCIPYLESRCCLKSTHAIHPP